MQKYCFLIAPPISILGRTMTPDMHKERTYIIIENKALQKNRPRETRNTGTGNSPRHIHCKNTILGKSNESH